MKPLTLPDKNLNLILASASPRRKEILNRVFNKISILKPEVDESSQGELHFRSYLRRVTQDKLNKSIQLLSENKIYKKGNPADLQVCVCADTIVYKNKILQKPVHYDEAQEMLESLAGKKHLVVTAVRFVIFRCEEPNLIVAEKYFAEITEVSFAKVDLKLLQSYIDDNHVYDKAGAYGIQDATASLMIEKIHGSYDNVMGFPLYSFCRHLQNEMEKIASKR